MIPCKAKKCAYKMPIAGNCHISMAIKGELTEFFEYVFIDAVQVAFEDEVEQDTGEPG